MAVDLPCSHCGREPSHPQIQHHFAWAAYHRLDLALATAQRRYVAALCAPCYEADRRARTNTAQGRFLGRVRRWSDQPANHGQLIRLVEHPEGVTGAEHEADTCFRDGATLSYRALAATAEGRGD